MEKTHSEKDYSEKELMANNEKTAQVFIQDNETGIRISKYLQLIQKKEVQEPFLSAFDIVLCLVVLAPCVVGFWRGTWILMDNHMEYFPIGRSLFLGLSIYTFFTIIQDNLDSTTQKKSKSFGEKILKMFLRRCYTYLFAVASVMQWRGGFEYTDYFFNVQKTPSGVVIKEGSGQCIFVFFASLIGLMLLRSLRNCVSAPFVFGTDDKSKTFTIPNRFRIKMSERTSLYLLDCLFSVLIIGALVVFVWRGAWALIDIYLFPENEVWSAWGSLVVGYSAVAIAFMLQPFMRWLCDRITGVSRVIIADLFLILSLIGTVNVWRGIWNLLNIYLLPDNLELSCWITHWVCLIILILLGCSNSLLVRGVYIDAEEPAGKCVIFPCYYLRLIFQEQKLKKLESEQGKTEMSPVKTCENNHIITIQSTNEPYPNKNHKEGQV